LPPQVQRQPVKSSANAWDAYALAALAAADKGRDWKDRVSFTSGILDQLERRLSSEIDAVLLATKHPCQFAFTPKIPFSPDLNQQGWRLIGYGIARRVTRLLDERKFDAAIDCAVKGTRFGYALTGGCAADASLGFWVVDQVRSPLLERMGEFSAQQLGLLAAGLQQALDAKPDLSVTIRHERLRFLAGVQYVQDHYQRREFDKLDKELRSGAREGVRYLRTMAQEDDAKREGYFRGFAKEAEEEIATMLSVYKLPAAQRPKWKAPDDDVYRPWKRFAMHYFGTGRVLVQMHDRALALSRLMILEAGLLAAFKTTREVSKDLGGFPKDTSTDPYTGRPFVFRASASDYRLYSVGPDLTDDGGDSDVSGLQRDLWLSVGGR
jgi:hypothetical protein